MKGQATVNSHFKNRIFLFVVSIFAVIVTLFVHTEHVDAGTLPASGDFSSSVRILVGFPSAGTGIDAPNSIVKIYSSSASITVNIDGFGQCNGDGYDYQNPGATKYEVFRTDANEARAGGVLSGGSANNGGVCSPNNKSLTVNHPGPTSNRAGHVGLYVFEFQATLAGSSLGFNGFTVSVPGQNLGYSQDSGDKFAIKSQFNLGGPTYSTFTLRFAPNCEVNTAQNKYLRWYDADQGEANQQVQISYDLYNETTGSYVLQNQTALGGQNAPGSAMVTFQPGNKYRWIWKNVSSYNGIQFELPYDSFYYQTTCPDDDIPTPFSCPGVPNLTQFIPFIFPGTPSNESAGRQSSPDGTQWRDYYYVYNSTPSSVSHSITSVTSRKGTPYQVSIPVGGGDYTHVNHGTSSDGINLNYSKFFQKYGYDTHGALVTYNYTITYTAQLYVKVTKKSTGAVVYDGPSSGGGSAPPTSKSKTLSGSDSSSGPVIGPCFDRGFDITPVIAGTSTYFDNPESPTRVYFGTKINANFSLPETSVPKELVEPFRINFKVAARYIVKRVDGTVLTYPFSRVPPVSASPASCAPYVGTALTGSFSDNDSYITGNRGPSQTINCDYVDTYNAEIPPLQAGDVACVESLTLSPATGRMGIDGTPTSISVNSRTDSNTNCATVVSSPLVNTPYFRAYNSDITAGIAGACAGWTTGNGKVIGYNDGTGKGSAVQLAIFSLNGVNGVTSATGRITTPIPSKGLTFANSGGTYGNPFNTGFCPPDYFANAVGATNVITASSVNAGSGALPNGASYKLGDITLNPGSGPGATDLSAGEKKVLYVKGNVYIKNNLNYTGVWSSIAELPSFALVVSGNIYIDKDVTNLDGFYIAQPNGSSEGQVYNCAVAPFTAVSTGAQLNTDCNKQLKINGAMLAKRIRLQRTKDSLRDSLNTELRTSPHAAEQFIFGPEAWLNPALNTGSNSYQYDSITSLAPVL